MTDPQPGHAFVYVATIQRMAVNILGRQAIFGTTSEEAIEDDADRLDIPIHAFDPVVADECHRGYTSQELSVWRATLDHFDAVKIGLTATPAAHSDPPGHARGSAPGVTRERRALPCYDERVAHRHEPAVQEGKSAFCETNRRLMRTGHANRLGPEPRCGKIREGFSKMRAPGRGLAPAEVPS